MAYGIFNTVFEVYSLVRFCFDVSIMEEWWKELVGVLVLGVVPMVLALRCGSLLGAAPKRPAMNGNVGKHFRYQKRSNQCKICSKKKWRIENDRNAVRGHSVNKLSEGVADAKRRL